MDGMYGWRARLGHVGPAILDTSSEEFRKLLPPGVLYMGLSVSQPVQQLTPENLERAGALIVDAAKRLAAEEASVIVSGGAPATASKGPDADRMLLEAMREATGVPCTTSNQSMVDALERLGLRRIVVVSPYIDARNEEIRTYLAACGVEVVAHRGLGLVNNVQFSKQPSWASYQLARDLGRAHPNADGVYIACPRWPVVDIVAPLEADIGKPVVGAATSMVWSALRLLNIGDPPRGYGQLMETLRAA
jgi:maleate cis-trans isomerase